MDFHQIRDKFCIYYLEIKDDMVDVANIEPYIKSHAKELKKIILKVRVNHNEDD